MKLLFGFYLIRVTRHDIIDGVECDACKCPIGLALRRLFPDAFVWNGGTFTVTNPIGGCRSLPRRALNFMKKFDNREPVGPFSFLVRVC